MLDFSLGPVNSSFHHRTDTLLPAGAGNVQSISISPQDEVVYVRRDGSFGSFSRWNYLLWFIPPTTSPILTETCTGFHHISILTRFGTVHSYGRNDYGQLDVPWKLQDAGGVVDIDAGYLHTVALMADGTVHGWGHSDSPREFNLENPTEWYWSEPLPLHEWNHATAIAAGAYHTVALLSDGTVVADDHWGNGNRYGQADVPDDLKDAIAIAAGEHHTVALGSDGTVVAWGNNDHGQTDVPEDLNEVVSIAAGVNHTVALKSDGTLINWGRIGIPPVDLSEQMADIKDIVAGDDHTIILKKDGTLINYGRRGSSLAQVPEGMDQAVSVEAGVYHAVALRMDGTVLAWGNNFHGQIEVPEGLSEVISIDAGFHHSLALREDGTVVAWGNNEYGQTDVPEGLDEVTGIYAGAYHSVALRSDGTIAAWGNDGGTPVHDPTGLSTVTHHLAACTNVHVDHAEALSGITDITDIAAGDCHTAALRSNGTVVVWGNNNFGQLDVPEGLAGVTQIAAGIRRTTALRSDRTVVSWGMFADRHLESSRFDDVIEIIESFHRTIIRRRNGTVADPRDLWREFHGRWINATEFAGGEYQYALLSSSLGRIDFAPGESSGILTIDVRADDDPEPDESFTVMLLVGNTDGWSGPFTARGIIRNDDHRVLKLIRPMHRNGTFSFSVALDDGTPLDSDDAQGFVVRSTRDFLTWRIERIALAEGNGVLHCEIAMEQGTGDRYFQVAARDAVRE